MIRTSHVLLALKDFKKARDFFLHMGYKPVTSATVREKPSQDMRDGKLPPEPDRVSVLADDRGFSMDLTIWYDSMHKYFGRSDLICLRVENLDEAWTSIENYPGIKQLVPPSPVSQEMVAALGNDLEPGRFAMISLDLDREDGHEQVIELIEGLVPEHLA